MKKGLEKAKTYLKHMLKQTKHVLCPFCLLEFLSFVFKSHPQSGAPSQTFETDT